MDDQHAAVTVSEAIGRNVSTLRRAVGLTQEELATAMTEVGFGWLRQTVTEVEAGRRSIAIEEVAALAALFDLDPFHVLLSPGSQVPNPYGSVQVGGATLSIHQWQALWAPRSQFEPPKGPKRAAIDALVGHVERPWARLWRKRGGHPGLPFREARERALTKRVRVPGPIFVSDEPVEFMTSAPPWSVELRIRLEPGVPYVPRDEVELEHISRVLEAPGLARRITRQEAYRLRRKKKGAKDGIR